MYTSKAAAFGRRTATSILPIWRKYIMRAGIIIIVVFNLFLAICSMFASWLGPLADNFDAANKFTGLDRAGAINPVILNKIYGIREQDHLMYRYVVSQDIVEEAVRHEKAIAIGAFIILMVNAIFLILLFSTLKKNEERQLSPSGTDKDRGSRGTQTDFEEKRG